MVSFQEMGPMTKDEEVVKSQHHRVPLLFCHPHQVGGQGNEVLEMNEVGFLLSQYF
jgi:hypothetical protein